MHESDPELPTTIVSQRYCRLCRKHKVRLVLEPAEVGGLMLGGGVNPSIQKDCRVWTSRDRSYCEITYRLAISSC